VSDIKRFPEPPETGIYWRYALDESRSQFAMQCGRGDTGKDNQAAGGDTAASAGLAAYISDRLSMFGALSEVRPGLDPGHAPDLIRGRHRVCRRKWL
jgi:hypothetical protein